MKHSVVIVTRNRPNELRRLLDCLITQTAPAEEILVVDASDGEETAELVFHSGATSLAPPRYLRAEADICEQRNFGIEACVGDIVTFLDDDALIGPEYFQTLLGYFEHDSSIAGVGGTMINAPLPGMFERVFRCLFLIQSNRGKNRFRFSGFPDFGFAFSQDCEVEFLATTAASFRKSAVGALRFDTGTFSGRVLGLPTGRAFAEDVWFSFEVGRVGRLIVTPSLPFHHQTSPAARDDVKMTQTLYYHAMRTVSTRAAQSATRRFARRWALLGCGFLSMLQSLVKSDSGYFTGFLASSRLRAASRSS